MIFTDEQIIDMMNSNDDDYAIDVATKILSCVCVRNRITGFSTKLTPLTFDGVNIKVKVKFDYKKAT